MHALVVTVSIDPAGIVFFDTEEAARQAETMAKNSPLPDPVKFTGFESREVAATT